jgi:hypothetical protein
MTVPLASLRRLSRLNVSILSQKLDLIARLIATHGDLKAMEFYKSPCPMMGASIGQHVRHSMDHMELAALIATNRIHETNTPIELHYDLRVRGGTAEHDMAQAEQRILQVKEVFTELSERSISNEEQNLSVKAAFMLSHDGIEYGLMSTIHRELGFCAHHAIHHMAMIRLIAIHHAGLSNLPSDFGRAPSTLNFDGMLRT